MGAVVEDEVMARDVHPAEVLMPDGTMLTRCRVFVTSHRMLAFGVGEGRAIKVLAELELAEPYSVPADRSTLKAGRLEIRTSTGETAWVNRGRGCGCGSALNALGQPAPWTRRR